MDKWSLNFHLNCLQLWTMLKPMAMTAGLNAVNSAVLSYPGTVHTSLGFKAFC